MHLYNTKTKTKELFVPLDPTHVRMYVCGPTVYGPIHVGNARPFVLFDVLFRLLRRMYPKVTYVRNITDVDDKILEAAAKNKESPEALTQRTTELFLSNVHALEILDPTVQPKATEHIPQMISLIQRLLDHGHAYLSKGHVLFSVDHDACYGSLSGRSLDDLLAGARVEVADYKENPGDFVLWKPAAAGETGWESPWGYGRPGWHIECSAMSWQYLGETFDIHAGGIDLLFPHHENEQAQSTCAFQQKTMANYWLHNGYLVVDGEKMSKSLGNFLTVNDVLQTHSGEAIRYVLIQAHYRQPMDFQKSALDSAEKILGRFTRALEGFDRSGPVAALRPDFLSALQDDLGTPQALAILHDQVGQIHKAETPQEKHQCQGAFWAMVSFLGFTLKEKTISDLKTQEIEAILQQRATARANKDFAKADELRQMLLDQGIVLEDKDGGSSWRKL